ncbi:MULTISPECIES: ParA family protein [Lactobacillaceae]|uniref:ParA family protein n=1 Tax=Lactobacillaceae TaxID=33958 RepID=UPI00081A7EA0|nr:MULTISPECIES: AAA family ATPase [Lactobacillaceae]RRG07341.1 MAG: ParA family protein [Lactobacillus sp.]ANZ65560.1 ATPase [Secundilactobacillus paracollinoides]MCT3570875.1 ParA family protein [Levilactobacillus brevis]MCT3584232.1 ParA family protein [Levilactobacillus brevis]MDM7552972.1 AAA family ATPase [Levilactobacillus brevis]
MTKKILFGNFKGGVGKTTNSVMTAYELAKKGYKTLVCDLDPQSNSTQLLRRTYGLQHNSELKIDKTMMVAIQEEKLPDAIVEIMNNLYLLPSYKDFVSYPDFLEMKFMPNVPNYKEKRMSYFGTLLSEVENKFDYIIFDVPPTLSIFTDTALYDTDYVIIVLQTQQRSLDGAEAFWEYLQEFYNNHTAIDFDIAGILPVLLKNNSGIDNQIIKDARETFGKDMIFENIMHHMERLKRYDRKGISEKGLTSVNDFHDIRLHALYGKLTEEIIARTGGK